MEDHWIFLPQGGYPADDQRVIIMLLTRCRDPYHDKGKEGTINITTAVFQYSNGRRVWDDTERF